MPRMKVLILGGAGIQGSASAYDLLKMDREVQVVLAERDGDRLAPVVAWLGDDRVGTVEMDVTEVDALAAYIDDEGCDVVISSVPWPVSIPPLEAAISAGADFIDYGLYQNRAFDLRIPDFDRRARQAGVTVIPSCGVAPGLTNMLAAHGASQLDRVEDVQIFVGGIPEVPEPPLQYKAVWSLEGVWTQFFEECRIIRDGELVEVSAGAGLEDLEIPGVGSLEAALTDGLGTLLHMYRDPIFEGVRNVFEKTIRHKGHYAKVMTLKECGLLNTEPIRVNDAEVVPREFLTKLLDPKLKLRDDERDMTVLRVRVTGIKDGRKQEHAYGMVDYKDLEAGVVSMGRTTGYTGSILAPFVYSDRIATTGVVEPERLGADRDLFAELLEEYARRGIRIDISSG